LYLANLTTAQKFLLKLLSFGAKGLPTTEQKSKIPGLQDFSGTPVTMEILKGVVTWSGQNATAFVNEGYAGNDIVYSVVNMISDKAKISPWGAYKKKNTTEGRKAAAKYEAKLKAAMNCKSIKAAERVNWKEIEELKNAAYEPYDNDDKLNQLLALPDPEGNTTWSELVEAAITFRLITGNSFIYGPIIEAGKNEGKPLFLMTLPSQWMSIIADLTAMYARAKAYRLYMGAGIGYPIPKEAIVHVAKFNPMWNASGQQLYGMSPLQAAQKKVTRINESLTASVANLQNGGPAGVLSLEHIEGMDQDVATEQVTQLRQKLVEYSGSKNKNRVATSGYPVKWTDIGLSNVDLAILEGERHDLRSICNVYNVPSTLLNDPDAKNENNQTAAEKALTVRAALPELIALRDALNMQMAKWGWKDIILDFDLSVFPELQEDKLTQAQFLDIACVTLKQRYEMMGLEADPSISDEMLNTIYYKGQPLSESGANDPLIDPYATQLNEPPKPKK
jgi:phage portal protein BeeE